MVIRKAEAKDAKEIVSLLKKKQNALIATKLLCAFMKVMIPL